MTIFSIHTVRTGNDVVFWCMLHVRQTPISSQPVQKNAKVQQTLLGSNKGATTFDILLHWLAGNGCLLHVQQTPKNYIIARPDGICSVLPQILALVVTKLVSNYIHLLCVLWEPQILALVTKFESNYMLLLPVQYCLKFWHW